MRLEILFEDLLWRGRLIVLVAVFGSLLASIGVFCVASVDAAGLAGEVWNYMAHGTAPGADHGMVRAAITANVVEIVDGYLLGTILLIFALGLYELFISRIEAAEGSEFAERVLLIRSLDDLKDRLAKVVLLILVVKFFEHAIQIPVPTVRDLLEMALAICLVAGALRLAHGGSKHTHAA